MVDSREKQPAIDRNLLEAPGNKTPEALLEALLVWGSRYKSLDTDTSKLDYIVKTFEGMYRDGVVVPALLPDEEVEERGPFAIEHYTDEESELTYILLYLHPGTIIDAINIASESAIEAVLAAFVKIAEDTIGRFKLLRGHGARFPNK